MTSDLAGPPRPRGEVGSVATRVKMAPSWVTRDGAGKGVAKWEVAKVSRARVTEINHGSKADGDALCFAM